MACCKVGGGFGKVAGQDAVYTNIDIGTVVCSSVYFTLHKKLQLWILAQDLQVYSVSAQLVRCF